MYYPWNYIWCSSVGLHIAFRCFCMVHCFLVIPYTGKLAASLSPMAALRTEEIKSAKIFKKSSRINPNGLAKNTFSVTVKGILYAAIPCVERSPCIWCSLFGSFGYWYKEKAVRQPWYENSSIYLELKSSTAAENATLELMKDSPLRRNWKRRLKNISCVTEIYPSKN